MLTLYSSSALYSYSDLKSAVNKYVDARQLTNPRDRSYVNVGTDKVLLSTVCAKGEAPESVEFLKREEIVRRLSEKMQSWYEVQAEGKDPILKYVAFCRVQFRRGPDAVLLIGRDSCSRSRS